MFILLVTISILLPPGRAIQYGGPIHTFTVQTNAAFANQTDCAEVGNRFAAYIDQGIGIARTNINVECYLSTEREV